MVSPFPPLSVNNKMVQSRQPYLLYCSFNGLFKVQGSRLFVTYTIIQGIISSEMEVRTGPLNGQCKKIKIKDDT